MPRITKVYTRKGDDGTTALGTSKRVPKDAARIEAYGTVDELNSVVGAAIAAGVDEGLASRLREIQNELLHLGADLCVPEQHKQPTPVPTIEPRHVEALEQTIDELAADLEPLENFLLPGGSPAAAQLHVARCVCRRAERRVLALNRTEPVGKHAIPYLNRLSDALFVMARFENHRKGVEERLWRSRG